MRPRRSESDNDVADSDRAAVDDVAFLDHTDRESREIVLALGVHAGHLRRLAPDEREARLLTPRRDALYDRRGDRNVELAAREVVEEEQWLGALDEDVVHAHRDEIDAHRVVTVHGESDHQLGADAIGAR